MKKTNGATKSLGVLAAALVAGTALVGCTAQQAEPEPEAAPTHQPVPSPSPTPSDDGYEQRYGQRLPVVSDDMTADERTAVESKRLLAVEKIRGGEMHQRLTRLFEKSNDTLATRASSYDPQEHFDVLFGQTVEGSCLVDKLDDQARADVQDAARKSMDFKASRDGVSINGYEFWLSTAYAGQDHDELLAATDALYAEVEATGCLVLDGSYPERL